MERLLRVSGVTINFYTKGSIECWKAADMRRVFLPQLNNLTPSGFVWFRQPRLVLKEMYASVKVVA